MPHPQSAVFAPLFVAVLALAQPATAGVTLTNLNRFQWAQTSIDIGSDGEFNQHNAPAGFDAWNDSISADSFTGSSSAVSSGTFTSPLVTPDAISISLYGEATATCNDAAVVNAEVNQEFHLEFDVTDAPAALIFTADKDTTFIGNGVGVAHGRLERLSPSYTLIWDTGLACNDVFILEPGSYKLTVNTYAGASVDNQIGVSSTHHATIDVDIVAGVPLVFEVDPLQSAITLDIQVPDMPPQQELVHFEGTVSIIYSECAMFGYASAAVLDMNLQMQEAEFVVQTTGDPVTLTGLAVAPTALGGASVMDGACCGLTDGCCTTLTDYELQAQAHLSVPALRQDPAQTIVWIALLNCVLNLFCDGTECGANPLVGGGLQFDTMGFPGINIVDAPIDLGLGAMNPTATITGDIVGTLKPEAPPCPIDLSGDDKVGIEDLLALLAAWGPCTGCPEDLDGDGNVAIFDLLDLLAAWGPCP